MSQKLTTDTVCLCQGVYQTISNSLSIGDEFYTDRCHKSGSQAFNKHINRIIIKNVC